MSPFFIEIRENTRNEYLDETMLSESNLED